MTRPVAMSTNFPNSLSFREFTILVGKTVFAKANWIRCGLDVCSKCRCWRMKQEKYWYHYGMMHWVE